MTKEQFILFLKDPNHVTEKEVTEIGTIIDRYPYFQAGRFLAAKVAEKFDIGNPSRKLTTAAVYSTNRAILKMYIQRGVNFNTIKSSLESERKKSPQRLTSSINQSKPGKEEKKVRRISVKSVPGAVVSDAEKQKAKAEQRKKENAIRKDLDSIAEKIQGGGAQKIVSKKDTPLPSKPLRQKPDPHKDAAAKPRKAISTQPPKTPPVPKIKDQPLVESEEILNIPTSSNVDLGLVDEVFDNLNLLQKNIAYFKEVEQNLDQKEADDAVSKALLKFAESAEEIKSSEERVEKISGDESTEDSSSQSGTDSGKLKNELLENSNEKEIEFRETEQDSTGKEKVEEIGPTLNPAEAEQDVKSDSIDLEIETKEKKSLIEESDIEINNDKKSLKEDLEEPEAGQRSRRYHRKIH